MRSVPQPERLGKFVAAGHIIRQAKAAGVLDEVLALTQAQRAALERASRLRSRGNSWDEIAKQLNSEAPRKDGFTWRAKRLRDLLGPPPKARAIREAHLYDHDPRWRFAKAYGIARRVELDIGLTLEDATTEISTFRQPGYVWWASMVSEMDLLCASNAMEVGELHLCAGDRLFVGPIQELAMTLRDMRLGPPPAQSTACHRLGLTRTEWPRGVPQIANAQAWRAACAGDQPLFFSAKREVSLYEERT